MNLISQFLHPSLLETLLALIIRVFCEFLQISFKDLSFIDPQSNPSSPLRGAHGYTWPSESTLNISKQLLQRSCFLPLFAWVLMRSDISLSTTTPSFFDFFINWRITSVTFSGGTVRPSGFSLALPLF